MKTISYVLMVIVVMTVVLLLGFAGDQFGPFGSMVLVLLAFMVFVGIGLTSSGRGGVRHAVEATESEASTEWSSTPNLSGKNWLDLVLDHNDMTRHISLEIDRSRRFDRSFTVVVIAPNMKALEANGVDVSTLSVLNDLRLFVQEVVVRQLRTTDVISNSVTPAVTIALLPETDSSGTDIAIGRIRDSLAKSLLSVGGSDGTQVEVSVMAVNYPQDVRDSLGVIEAIKEFEERISAAAVTS